MEFGRLNHAPSPWSDAYHELLVQSWPVFIGWAFVSFVLVNLTFACLFVAGGDCYNAGDRSNLWTAFTFSAQTMTTIGYGGMTPTTLWADIVVVLESFIGVLFVAVFSGLCFAKFARPDARVAFSHKAVIAMAEGRPCLMLRMANERSSRIIDAHVHVFALLDYVSPEGQTLRRFHTLPLQRDHTPVFTMSWQVMHFLDTGPIADLATQDMPDLMALVVTVTGTDSTFMQTVHSQRFYQPHDIERGMRFVDMIVQDGDRPAIDHGKLHDTTPDPAWPR